MKGRFNQTGVRVIERREFLLYSLAFAAAAGVGCRDFQYQNFSADQLGSEVVPPTTSNAIGTVAILVNPDGSRAEVTVTLAGSTKPTAVHLHRGDPGTPESEPLFLVWSPLRGEFTPSQPVAASWQPTSGDLVDLRAGRIYADIHTEAWPEGELRGQLEA